MNNLLIKNDDARPEMDALLGEFFQSETPHPWPGFKAPLVTRVKEPESLWSRTSARLMLAASIALLILGYLSLGTFFPRSQTPTGVHEVAPPTAHRDKSKQSPPPPVLENSNQEARPIGMLPR